jgi:hypothetical protein
MSIIEEQGEQDEQGERKAEPTSGRRALFSKGAAAAAAATVAGLALGKQASAANGDTFIIGATNTATNTTLLQGGSTLRVNNGGSSGRNAAVLGGNKLASIYATQSTSNRVGVFGEATGTSGGWGVLGYNSSSSGRGVVGITVGGSGVGVYGEHADTSTSGTGVLGISRFGDGVVGIGTAADVVAYGSGRVRLQGVGNTGSPTAPGSLGTIARDSGGNLWYAVANNAWRKVAGPGTAGAFHAVTPFRVYDSRWPSEAGRLAADQNRVVSVKDARNLSNGAVTTANAVPSGARAVVGNLTISGTLAGPGALGVTPGNASALGSSTINWNGPGVLLANGFTCALDSNRQLKIWALGTAGTNFIIDISGYYL